MTNLRPVSADGTPPEKTGSGILKAEGLKKTYGGFSISLDLSVGPGETLALVGPSGSGKTTALNLIAGLAAPESGTVCIGGKDITGLPPWKRNISVVFQDLALFPHLDVGGNIAYGLFIKKVPRKERRRVVEEMLELVRLPGYAPRRITTLSGGERQRVAIARALASSPGALLLDEPFSSLDAPLRKSLRREFLEIRAHSEAPCIFITHDREEAVMLGDRIALMEAGRIVESGTGRELLFAPATESAARFFGAGQVLPCRVLAESSDSAEVSTPLGILTVPVNPEDGSARSMLFIPYDAAVYAGAPKYSPETGNPAPGSGHPLPGQGSSGALNPSARIKTAGARLTGSLFEGQGLILRLALKPWENRGGFFEFPFELRTGPRVEPPAAGSRVNFLLDQDLIRFVKQNVT